MPFVLRCNASGIFCNIIICARAHKVLPLRSKLIFNSKFNNMKKILSLFLALLTVSVMNAKVAFLVPANNTSRESLASFEIDGAAQDPEKRAYDWFNTNFVEPGNGQFICLDDLNSMPNDVYAIWIYVDRVGFDAGQFDALFTSHISELQAFVNAGGNLFLCKQATRLEKDLVGATDGQSSEPGTGNVIIPDYNHNNINEPATWAVDFRFELPDDWQHRGGHAIYANVPHRNENEAELIWTSGRKLTNNNCGIGIGTMGMNDIWDKDRFHAFETRNNCQVLGGWANGDGCHYGGVIEFFPTGNRKGTVLMLGLAAYQWINNNAGNGWENTQKITQNVLEYLGANPNLHWNEETIPTSGVINEQHIMTASANAGYTVRYYPNTDVEIANIGEADGNIYFNYFGTATFRAEAEGDGWTLPKNKYVIYSPEITITGGTDANPRYAYVLPYSMHTMANYDNEEGLRPDFEAAAWFYQQFIVDEVGGKHGCFVRPSDLASLNPAIKVLWIHNDHVGKDSQEYYNDLGDDTFRDNLSSFIADGGKVFVSKQATRLIGDLGRASYPAYQNGGYGDRGPWRVGNTWNLDGEFIDHSTHAVYANIGTNTEIMAEGRHTDNNCIYNNDMLGWTGNRDPQKLHDFETANNCLILGTWGHDNNVLECVGFVEFYPQNTTEGTIIAMGLAAFHWANPTDAIKTLTRDILYYLNIEETPLFTWVNAPADGSVGTEQFVNVEHKDSEIHWTSSDNDVVEIVDDPEHPGDPEYKKLILKAAGTVTITATRTGDGYKIPKNVKSPTHATQTITVTNGYTRNGLLQDYYYTVCLPKGAVSYTGAEMFKIADKTANNDIVIEEVDDMEAGIPYIFLATAEQLNVVYDNNDPVAAQSDNGLVGYIGTEALELSANENYYILAKNQIWQVDQTATVPSNRAYIDMSAIHPKTPAPGKKRYVISSQHTATGIEGTNANESSKAKKIVRDGQLLIKQGEHVYNAQGQIIK